MKTITTISALQRELAAHGGRSVGFVPTMGFLHEGHLQLVRTCRAENEVVVVSIFVNPTQFGPNEDFQRYPRDLPRDSAMLEQAGTDILFAPAAEEMFPPPYRTYVQVEELEAVLCGRSRPGHFRGVATVVLKLFNIVGAKRAYFGQKDAQQAILLQKMVRDLNVPVTIRVLPIVRDHDGLALSSRNIYLSAEERQAALHLPRALQEARAAIAAGQDDAAAVQAVIRTVLARSPLIQIDYVQTVHLDTLLPVERILSDRTLVACAVRVGKTRLIDNFVLGTL